MVIEGEMRYCVKKITPEIAKRDIHWMHNFAYKRAEKEEERLSFGGYIMILLRIYPLTPMRGRGLIWIL